MLNLFLSDTQQSLDDLIVGIIISVIGIAIVLYCAND